MNVGEGLDLQHDANPAVARALVPAAEQPAVDFLALRAAVGNHFGERRLRVGDQVAQQPEVQRVRAGDVGLIGQAVGARAIAGVERIQLLVVEIGVRQMLLEKTVEDRPLGIRHQVAMHGRQAHGCRPHALQEGLDALLGALVAVLLPETLQEHRALAIGEAGQVFLAARVLVVPQQFGTVDGFVGAVAHQITHQPYEGQIDRFAQRLAYGGDAPVVFTAEVAEAVHAGAGEEAFGGAGRVAPIQRGVEHALQAAVAVRGQVINGPAA